jgi:hypothetical protein
MLAVLAMNPKSITAQQQQQQQQQLWKGLAA